jgi:hypothetical protein
MGFFFFLMIYVCISPIDDAAEMSPPSLPTTVAQPKTHYSFPEESTSS